MDDTLKDIAKNNNSSPAKIYGIIKLPLSSQTGMEYGKITLEQICKKKGIDINKAIKKLNKEGIKADPDDKLKDLAFPNKLTPLDIINIIEK